MDSAHPDRRVRDLDDAHQVLDACWALLSRFTASRPLDLDLAAELQAVGDVIDDATEQVESFTAARMLELRHGE